MGVLDAPPAELKRLATQLGINTTGLTPTQLSVSVAARMQPVIEARQQFGAREIIRGAVFKAPANYVFNPSWGIIGNSIAQGSGASGLTNWMWRLAARLNTLTNLGVGDAAWTASNYGNGGSEIPIAAAFVAAPVPMNNPNGALPEGIFAQTPRVNQNLYRPWWVLGGARNEVGAYAAAPAQALLDNYRTMLAATIDALIEARADVVLYSDPPAINASTGVQTTASAQYDQLFVDIQREVARSRGITFVDLYLHWQRLAVQGTDLRTLSNDGTHPNDAGHDVIAALIYQALMFEPLQGAGRTQAQNGRLLWVYPGTAGRYGGGTINAAPTTDASTIRNGVLKTQDSFDLGANATVNLEAYAGLVYGVGLLRNTGGAQLNFTSTGGAVQAGLNTAFPGLNRERSVLIRQAGARSVSKLWYIAKNASGSGTASPAGLVAVGPLQTGHLRPDATLTTAVTGWTAATNGANPNSWDASADGSEFTMEFYGTGALTTLNVGPGMGKMDVYVDGATTAANTLDSYSTGTGTFQYELVKGLRYGRHTLRIKANGKNASSSGFAQKIYAIIPTDDRSAPDGHWIVAQDGLTYNLPGRFEEATISRVIAGTPVLAQDRTLGTVSVTGGSALVRVR